MPVAIQADSNFSVGRVYGPFLEGTSYKSYKLVSFANDTIQSARASHILFKLEDKATAEQVLAEAIAGAVFAELPKQHGTDGTKEKGGDLDEFTTGQMVAPFQAAVFSAKKLGVLPTLVETQFGFHIIKVTNLVKTKEITKKYKIVTLDKELIASRQTRDNAYRDASIFLKEATNYATFTAKAKEKNLTVQTAENIAPTAQGFNTLSSAREIVQWAYRDADKEEVSKVFELNNDVYVIAVVKDEYSKDDLTLSSVKEEVKRAYLNDKKAAQLTTEIKALTGTLAEKQQKLVTDKKYYAALQSNAPGINLENPYISGAGQEVTVISTAFGLQKGKESDVIQGDNGVYVIQTQEVVIAKEVADYTNSKNALLGELQGGAPSRYGASANSETQKINEVIKNKAKIKDLRYNIY